MNTTYAVRKTSHYQGCHGPGALVARFDDRQEAEKLIDEISTCSFCHPGRTAQYSTGQCYDIWTSHKPATDDTAEEALIRMRDEQDEDDAA